jgi:hypothetical protein
VEKIMMIREEINKNETKINTKNELNEKLVF